MGARGGQQHPAPQSAGLALGLLEELNSLPRAIAGYSTLTSWEAFLALQLLQALLAGALQFAAPIFLFAAAGETLYRQHFPHHLQLGASFSWPGFMSRPGALGLGIGALLSGLFVCYQ